MAFTPGDAVHVRSIGKGIVREVRNGGRLLVEVNGRSIVTTEDQVSVPPAEKRRAAVRRRGSPAEYRPASETSLSLDLHGLTVDEAHDAVIAFIDRALREGAGEVRFIHGRSGGRLRIALHSQLKSIPAVRNYRLDPANAGVTVVSME